METFIQLTVTGLANGAILALAALGFVLIFKATGVINFAQGHFLLVGAYVVFAGITQVGLHWSIAVGLAVVVAVLLGVTIERLVLRPLVGEDVISVIMVTIGLAAILQSSTEVLEVPTGRVRVFVEALLPPPRLLVCGAGHDAMPLVDSAAALGWHVLVVDDRRAMLDERRFPAASGFVHVDQPADAATAAGHDERTYVVVMTHNYLRDLDYLRSFLGTGVAYIGMLGPRRRLERLLGDLAGEGVRPTEADLATLHGPAGLDIGADGPDEIAAAIVAEITAVHRGRSGGFLRDRDGPIHDRRDASPAPLAP